MFVFLDEPSAISRQPILLKPISLSTFSASFRSPTYKAEG